MILAIERRHKAEITISPQRAAVGEAQAGDMKAAVNEALSIWKAGSQIQDAMAQQERHDRRNERQGSAAGEPPAAIGLAETADFSLVVHRFPAVAKSTEVHLVRSEDAVALRP